MALINIPSQLRPGISGWSEGSSHQTPLKPKILTRMKETSCQSGTVSDFVTGMYTGRAMFEIPREGKLRTYLENSRVQPLKLFPGGFQPRDSPFESNTDSPFESNAESPLALLRSRRLLFKSFWIRKVSAALPCIHTYAWQPWILNGIITRHNDILCLDSSKQKVLSALLLYIVYLHVHGSGPGGTPWHPWAIWSYKSGVPLQAPALYDSKAESQSIQIIYIHPRQSSTQNMFRIPT